MNQELHINNNFNNRIEYYEKTLYNQWFLREFNYLIMVLDAFIKELYNTNKQLVAQMYVELINAKKPLLEAKNIKVFLNYKYFFYMNYLLELCKVVENEFIFSYLKYNFFKNDKNISNSEAYFRTKQKLQIKYSGFHFIPLHQIPDVFIFLEKNICRFADYRNFEINRISSYIYEKCETIENFDRHLEENF